MNTGTGAMDMEKRITLLDSIVMLLFLYGMNLLVGAMALVEGCVHPVDRFLLVMKLSILFVPIEFLVCYIWGIWR